MPGHHATETFPFGDIDGPARDPMLLLPDRASASRFTDEDLRRLREGFLSEEVRDYVARALHDDILRRSPSWRLRDSIRHEARFAVAAQVRGGMRLPKPPKGVLRRGDYLVRDGGRVLGTLDGIGAGAFPPCGRFEDELAEIGAALEAGGTLPEGVPYDGAIEIPGLAEIAGRARDAEREIGRLSDEIMTGLRELLDSCATVEALVGALPHAGEVVDRILRAPRLDPRLGARLAAYNAWLQTP